MLTEPCSFTELKHSPVAASALERSVHVTCALATLPAGPAPAMSAAMATVVAASDAARDDAVLREENMLLLLLLRRRFGLQVAAGAPAAAAVFDSLRAHRASDFGSDNRDMTVDQLFQRALAIPIQTKRLL